MSVESFEAALQRREQEVTRRLRHANDDERRKLEKEREEIARQLSDIETAYAEAQSKISALARALARFGDDIGGDRLEEARAALAKGDFSKADALLAETEARADVEVTNGIVESILMGLKQVWDWSKISGNSGALLLFIAAVTLFWRISKIRGKPKTHAAQPPFPPSPLPSPPPPAPSPPPPEGGSVHMSVEDFQDALLRREREVTERLRHANDDERRKLENEKAEIARQLSDLETAYAEAQSKISDLETALARFGNDVGGDRLEEARAALAKGDFSKADTLLAEIEAHADMEVGRGAEAAFRRGEIAALQIRWGEAAAHFEKAARLGPSYAHLGKASEFLWRAGRLDAARQSGRKFLALSRRDYGEKARETAVALDQLGRILNDMGEYPEAEPLFRQALEIGRETLGERHPDYAAGLNNLAGLLQATGRYEEAEPLFRQALEIDREALGERHPDYAARLNNLAGLLQATGRYEEAEPLFRQALEIDREALGERHPDYAARLNNLAGLLQTTGRYEEAEPLFRQGLEIGRETLGERHPTYAAHLNNLAGVLQTTGRYEEAEPLYRQALEINRETLGEQHPTYATGLNNLAGVLESTGRYEEAKPLLRQALEIFRAALGDAHPNTRQMAENYAGLLRVRFPDHPVLVELRAAFGEEIGRP